MSDNSLAGDIEGLLDRISNRLMAHPEQLEMLKNLLAERQIFPSRAILDKNITKDYQSAFKILSVIYRFLKSYETLDSEQAEVLFSQSIQDPQAMQTLVQVLADGDIFADSDYMRALLKSQAQFRLFSQIALMMHGSVNSSKRVGKWNSQTFTVQQARAMVVKSLSPHPNLDAVSDLIMLLRTQAVQGLFDFQASGIRLNTLERLVSALVAQTLLPELCNVIQVLLECRQKFPNLKYNSRFFFELCQAKNLNAVLTLFNYLNGMELLEEHSRWLNLEIIETVIRAANPLTALKRLFWMVKILSQANMKLDWVRWMAARMINLKRSAETRKFWVAFFGLLEFFSNFDLEFYRLTEVHDALETKPSLAFALGIMFNHYEYVDTDIDYMRSSAKVKYSFKYPFWCRELWVFLDDHSIQSPSASDQVWGFFESEFSRSIATFAELINRVYPLPQAKAIPWSLLLKIRLIDLNILDPLIHQMLLDLCQRDYEAQIRSTFANRSAMKRPSNALFPTFEDLRRGEYDLIETVVSNYFDKIDAIGLLHQHGLLDTEHGLKYILYLLQCPKSPMQRAKEILALHDSEAPLYWIDWFSCIPTHQYTYSPRELQALLTELAENQLLNATNIKLIMCNQSPVDATRAFIELSNSSMFSSHALPRP